MRKLSTSSSSQKRNKNNKNNNNRDAKKRSRNRKQFVPRSFLECKSLAQVVGFPPQNKLVTTSVVSDFVKELFLDRFVKEIVKPFQPDKTTKKNRTTPTAETNAGYCHVMVGGRLVKKRRISQDNTIQPKRRTTTPSPSEQSRPTDEIDGGLAKKRRIWKEHIVIGTNQCLRLLENMNDNDCDNDTASKAPTKRTKTKDDASGASRAFRKPSIIVIAKDIYPPTMCCAVPVLAKRLGIPLLLLPGKASLELGKALNAKRTSILILCCGDNDVQTNNNGSSDPSGGVDCLDKEISESRTAMASFVSFIVDQIPENNINLLSSV